MKGAAAPAQRPYREVLYALILSNGVSLLLMLSRMVASDSSRYWFLLWNLILGWLPVVFAIWLSHRLRHSRWLSAGNLVLTALWLGFLPNSFYLVSDLIHLQITGEVSVLYDAVLFMSFIFNGYVAGFMSIYVVHKEVLRRLGEDTSHLLISGVLLLSSLAIYLGRALRWNTWDVLVNPAGILFDVSEQVINPVSHPQSVVTTLTFFMLLGSMYAVIWQVVHALRSSRP
jgi:uncharacterized membrane protein